MKESKSEALSGFALFFCRKMSNGGEHCVNLDVILAILTCALTIAKALNNEDKEDDD